MPKRALPSTFDGMSVRAIGWPTMWKSSGFLSGTLLKSGTGSFDAA